MPHVTIVVPTRNSERTLKACLESARAQQGTNVEVIVVDNSSTDATPEIASSLADVVLQAGPERSAQRNAGVAVAKGDYVLIVDADMVLSSNVVASAFEQIERGAEAVAIPETSFGEGFWSACKALERSCYDGDATVSAARFFPRERLAEIGGFDERLLGGEDWDISLRAVRSTTLAFAAGRIYHDEGHQTLGAIAAKKFCYGKSLPLFVRKHGRKGLTRLNPLRWSLVRNLPRMLRHPIILGGCIVMKTAELCAIVCGMASSVIAPPGRLQRR
jgi:glycosyltransferase involved in cell wall biosynthesis